MQCDACRRQIEEDAKFCPWCGTRQNTANPVTIERHKQAGLKVLKLLVEYLLSNIPIYGGLAKFGFNIALALKEVYGKSPQQTYKREELVASMRSLTIDEVTKVVDEAFASPMGQEAEKHLTPQQQRQVRQQLLRVPSEIEAILVEIETQDKQEAEKAKIEKETRERENEAARRKEQATKFAQLKDKLAKQLQDRQFSEAFVTAERMREIYPRTRKRKWCMRG